MAFIFLMIAFFLLWFVQTTLRLLTAEIADHAQVGLNLYQMERVII